MSKPASSIGLSRVSGLLLLLFAYPSPAAENLCTPREASGFSCPTANGRKIVSVCVSGDISENAGYLVYRFGTPGGKVELSTPGRPTEFRKFTSSSVLDFPKGEGDYIRFRNGAYSYVVYVAAGNGWEKGGVAVFKGGKHVRTFPCDPNTLDVAALSPSFSSQMGIPEEGDAEEARTWKVLKSW